MTEILIWIGIAFVGFLLGTFANRVAYWVRLRHKLLDAGKGMEIAYVCNAGRDIYYRYVNDAEMPMSRHLAAETALREYDLRMTRPYLIEQFGLMRADANAGELVGLFERIAELEKRLYETSMDEILLKISAVYFFMRGETSAYDPHIAKYKIEKWKESPEALDFFLLEAWRRITGSEISLDTPIQTSSQPETTEPVIRQKKRYNWSKA